MNIKIINVPSGIKYLSDVEEIKTEFNNDLPHNSVIDKTLTGIGGTHLALVNDVPYIVAVPLIRMIKNKVEQEKYSHVLPVTSETTYDQLKEHLAKGNNKFLATYDSVERLADFLGPRCSEYCLLVDELHKLIQFLDRFKPSVAIKLLSKNSRFKSVSYLTATPTRAEYLPKPLQELQFIKFEWEDAEAPNLKHLYVPNNITESALQITLDALDNSEQEVYIFYNSKRNVCSFINKLLKCKKDLKLEDINLLFAETDSNTKYFRKYLSKDFEYGYFPDGLKNKRVNIISSMGYEGSDYYPNNDPSKTPLTLVVSDPNAKSMRFDIGIDLVQIAGRFRANKTTGEMQNYPIIYLWNTQKTDYVKSEEEFTKLIEEEERLALDALEKIKDNAFLKRSVLKTIESDNPIFLYEENGEATFHPFGKEASLSSYHAMHSDSYVLCNVTSDNKVKEDSIIKTKLADLSPNLSTYTLPPLSSVYIRMLGRKPSVENQIKQYRYAMELSPDLREEALDNFFISNPDFAEWLDSGVTVSNMLSLGKVRTKIDELATELRKLDNASNIEIEEGFYSNQAIKTLIQEYYDSINVSKKAKATDLEKLRPDLTIRKTNRIVDNKKVNGLLIERK